MVHAGLTWDDLTIADIQQENRFFVIPPHDSVQQQLMWSDPGELPFSHSPYWLCSERDCLMLMLRRSLISSSP